MKNYGRCSVSDFLGDYIVYRNLVPVDPNLPSLDELGPRVDLTPGMIPRKIEPIHSRVMIELLTHARTIDAPGVSLERLVYLGDTRSSDGTCFSNLCHAADLPGLAFICAENKEAAGVEIQKLDAGTLYLANRWSMLSDFDAYCVDQDLAIDERTAVIVDVDKTALGARGRNDQVINRARLEAVRLTVGDLLGERFDEAAFEAAYDTLNQSAFHGLTADNQDYLAYICLMLGSGLYELEALITEVQAGKWMSFQQFIDGVEARAAELPADLRGIHAQIYANVRRGDPTPFKAFRYNEYRTTLAHMGSLPDGVAVEALLRDEIVLTQELREIALKWQAQGALLFGLSDKPDEASLPSPEQAAQGMLPIHRARTHAVGT
ncbi:MAG: hypothetical protein P8Z34_16240 [Anaerolineales bacterium]